MFVPVSTVRLRWLPCYKQSSYYLLLRQRFGKRSCIKRFGSQFPSSVESEWGVRIEDQETQPTQQKQIVRQQTGAPKRDLSLPIPVLPRFTSMADQYAKAIEALNGELQTNFAVLEMVKQERREQAHLRLQKTFTFLQQSGMSLEDLDELGVIHVSGTKGKGSTCAFCESILRQRGLKTGLFTSPHLLSVTERIRIGGEPIEKALFAHYFWMVYDKIVTANPPDQRPIYFQFLTILAFNIFWREGVDVAIMEVGVGGRFDSTNIVRKPVVCGITTLDIDHTSILGKTIEEIAWQKAGIMKSGVPTLVDGCQTEGALEVLSKEADKTGSQMETIPPLEKYSFPPTKAGDQDLKAQSEFGPTTSDVYRRNASLALQLSRTYYQHHVRKRGFPLNPSSEIAEPFTLEPREAAGLRLCKWPGRAQVIHKKLPDKSLVWFMDGAHTQLSMESCVQWFTRASEVASEGRSNRKVFRGLIFNLTKADREARPLLQMLARNHTGHHFDIAVFTPNVVRNTGYNADNDNKTISVASQVERCKSLANIWEEFNGSQSKSLSVESIDDAIDAINEMAQSDPDKEQTQVLVTGSLLLLGNVLQIVEPNLLFKSSPDEERAVLQSYK